LLTVPPATGASVGPRGAREPVEPADKPGAVRAGGVSWVDLVPVVDTSALVVCVVHVQGGAGAGGSNEFAPPQPSAAAARTKASLVVVIMGDLDDKQAAIAILAGTWTMTKLARRLRIPVSYPAPR
jgi:hypothetical protein